MFNSRQKAISLVIVHVTVPEVKPSKVKGAGGLYRINELISNIENKGLNFNLYFITSSAFYAGIKCKKRCKPLIIENSRIRPVFWAKVLYKTFTLVRLLKRLSNVSKNILVVSFTHYPFDLLLSCIVAKITDAPLIVYVQLYLKRSIIRRIIQNLSLMLIRTFKPYIFVINCLLYTSPSPRDRG